MFSFRLKKQTSTNVADTNWKGNSKDADGSEPFEKM